LASASGKQRKENKIVISKNKPMTKKKYDLKTKPRILLVEDDPDNMTTIRAILKDKYRILEATDGEQGLEAIKNNLPDLVLLDIGLPKMDGFAVIKNIRQNKKTSGILVIALTSYAMKGDKQRIIEAGCNDYIAKPLNVEELLEKIKKHLAR